MYIGENFNLYSDVNFTSYMLFEQFHMHTSIDSSIQLLRVRHKPTRVPCTEMLGNILVLTSLMDERIIVVLRAMLYEEKQP